MMHLGPHLPLVHGSPTLELFSGFKSWLLYFWEYLTASLASCWQFYSSRVCVCWGLRSVH